MLDAFGTLSDIYEFVKYELLCAGDSMQISSFQSLLNLREKKGYFVYGYE